MTRFALLAGAALALISTPAAAGILGGSQAKPSSGRNEQTKRDGANPAMHPQDWNAGNRPAPPDFSIQVRRTVAGRG